MRRAPLLFLLMLPALGAAQETWQTALNKMPLEAGVACLSRTNCVKVMLRAFTSNQLVKALVLMPGATDEFYMFRRAQAQLTTSSPTLLDAVSALTNQTRIQVTFKPPFLLLHTDTDPLEPKLTIHHQPTAERFKQERFCEHVALNDIEWDSLQPLLKKRFQVDVRPWRFSPDAYHFYRCAFTGWNLTNQEMIEAVMLASQTCATMDGPSLFRLQGAFVRFESDLRAGQTVPH